MDYVTASKLLLNMDEKVDPCDDFYEFSCGSFLRNTRIPDDKTSVNTFSIITDQLQEQIRALLDEPVAPEEPRPFALAKTLYQACMNRSKFREVEFKEVAYSSRRQTTSTQRI